MATIATETRSPVEIARLIFETVLNQRDAGAVRPYWADDLVEELPTGTYRGPDEMARYFAETFAALPDFHIEPEQIIGEDDTVFVKWRLTGTFQRAFVAGNRADRRSDRAARHRLLHVPRGENHAQ